MPPTFSCLKIGPFYSEVTRAFCRVPSTSFSQAPWYTLPSYLCRFTVRSICYGYFQEPLHGIFNPIRKYNLRDPSTHSRYRNINLFPIDYAFLPRLRGRLTLRGLALRRNPWAFGEGGSHSLYRYSCQHSRFRYLQQTLRFTFTGLRNAPLPLVQRTSPQFRCVA